MISLPGSPEYRIWLAQQYRKDRLARTEPTAPVGLAAVNAAGAVAVTWPVVPGLIVTLYRGTTAVFADATALQSFDGATGYTDSAVLGATDYWYWLTAANAVGESDESIPATVTTP